MTRSVGVCCGGGGKGRGFHRVALARLTTFAPHHLLIVSHLFLFLSSPATSTQAAVPPLGGIPLALYPPTLLSPDWALQNDDRVRTPLVPPHQAARTA